MTLPNTQSAIIQSKAGPRLSDLPLAITHSKALPDLLSPYHVLVRVLAVGLNPTDVKMTLNFYMEGNAVGCDFCGVVVMAGPSSVVPVGVRILGANFPYRHNNNNPSGGNGAFAQYAMCDSREALRVPGHWSDLKAAALGVVGSVTACLALSDPDALGLEGRPSRPAQKRIPVLVYGGATATGIVAIQILNQSGYAPIAICSPKSAQAVVGYGAVGTSSYLPDKWFEEVKELAGGLSIKRALDCITTPESVSHCFQVLGRVRARYACLEDCPEAWQDRSSVKVKVVMGFEGMGMDVDLNHPVYTRMKNPLLHSIRCEWVPEIQSMLDKGQLEPQKYKKVDGGFDGVITAMQMLHRGDTKGEKLVIQLGSL